MVENLVISFTICSVGFDSTGASIKQSPPWLEALNRYLSTAYLQPPLKSRIKSPPCHVKDPDTLPPVSQDRKSGCMRLNQWQPWRIMLRFRIRHNVTSMNDRLELTLFWSIPYLECCIAIRRCSRCFFGFPARLSLSLV